MPETSSKPPCLRDDALAVLDRLRGQGHIAYFAGGCVRDMLMGLEPKDYDIATDATPQRVRQIFSHTQAVGAAFGVILVHEGDSAIEVATFRSDLTYADGRRPEGVRFSTPQEDAQRRDFTINGLFFDPHEDKVIDFVNGERDLENRVLRAIGDPEERFGEDHLRLLRAVRFAARFELRIEEQTAKAISRNAPALIRISPERIAEELRMMICPPTRTMAAKLLWQFNLPHILLRDLGERPLTGGTQSLFEFLPGNSAIPFGLALAAFALDYRLRCQERSDVRALLSDAEARTGVRACRKDLKISNDEAEIMSDCLRLDFLLGDASPSVAKMKRFLAGANSRAARMMLEACASIDPFVKHRVEWIRKRFIEFPPSAIAPAPLINGEDLLAAGLAPGPLFKKILSEVYDAQLEGKISARVQAMALAMKIRGGKSA